jgi:TfoX/Sxy family transcriptional regulator of competence genes
MAIQKSYKFDTEFGLVTVAECYIKVSMVEVNKVNGMASVSFYDKPNGKLLQTKIYPVPHDLDGSNALIQAYNHLKTMDEFAGATDC